MTGLEAIGSLTTFRHGRNHGGQDGTADGAILFDDALFDGERLQSPRPGWFEPAHWGRNAHPVHAGGRGGAWFVDAPFGPAVLRHYLRGGMAARVSRERYLWQGEAQVRSFAEYRLTAALLQRGLPVPRPLAACYWREGMRYRAAILLERLHPVRTLAQCVDEDPAHAPWEGVGRLVARFHREGLDHADLNANNILIATEPGGGDGWLIDFDRGRLRKPGRAWRENNLARLLRSLQKLRGARRRSEVEADFACLRAAYDAALGQGA
jgi:3-deoxy-D-manno-octulosonic acid kinase